MAFDFKPEQPALNFAPRYHARWCSREFLLWPAWAYRVVAPRVRQRKLNVLQRAVMGLCRAGVTRVDAIAEHLSVHRDLAAFIVSELLDFGHLDHFGQPTVQGEQVLEEDSFESHEMIVGYVFQDPWSGDLWPRFVESLDYCRREFNGNGFPTILLGNTGDPKRHPAFTVLPRGAVSPSTPSAAAVVQAVTQHRRGLRFKDADDPDDESLGSYVASGAQISRVSFVEEEPQAVFLLTYLYVPESDAGATDWYACDPFGLGQSARLRRQVEKVMRNDTHLLGVVNRLIDETLRAGYEDQQRWLEEIQLRAGLEVDQRFTVNFRTHSAFEQMLDLEAARQEMRSLGRDCPERKINEVLRAGVKVLEAVFASIAVTHPLGDIWKRVYVPRVDRVTGKEYLAQQQDPGVCSALYEGAFRSIGFTPPIPDSFLKVKPGQLRAVSERGDHWRLRALVTATALLAHRYPMHPLAQTAASRPDLLGAIDEIANVGGGAGHAHGRSVEPQMAEQQTDKVYEVVAALLDLGETTANSMQQSTGSSHV